MQVLSIHTPGRAAPYIGRRGCALSLRFLALWAVDVLPLIHSGVGQKVNVVSCGPILINPRHDIMTLFVLSLSKYSK